MLSVTSTFDVHPSFKGDIEVRHSIFPSFEDWSLGRGILMRFITAYI